MICWGERDCCGLFVDRESTDRCDCLQDYCIRDYEPDQRIMVRENDLDKVLSRLYFNADEHLVELHEMLSIKCVSNSAVYQHQNKQIIDRLAQRLVELHFDVDIVELRSKTKKPAHYVIFANYFSTPTKNVMLVYGKVNVPKIERDDGWSYEPYGLTKRDGVLYGLGLTCSKGPVMCWIHAVEAWMQETGDLPVNFRLIIDSNDYSNSKTLQKLIRRRKNFFRSVDLLIGMTNFWIAEKVPMLTTNHSGYIYYELEVRKAKTTTDNNKSGETTSSRTLPEPMFELCLLMNTLMDSKNDILVDGFQRHVLPMTQRDWDILGVVEVGTMAFKENVGTTGLPHEKSRQEFLKHKWCLPSLSIHSVEYTKASLSLRDFTPLNDVVAKFSIKLVPDQSIEYVRFKVRDHLDTAYKNLKCENPAYLRVLDQLKPLNEGRHAPFHLSAMRAYERVYDCHAVIPDTISISQPILNELRKYCMAGAQVLAIPFCSIHKQPHEVDECLKHAEFQKNQALFATLLYEVARMPAECKCTPIKDYCYEPGTSTDKDFVRMLLPRHQSISHVLYELDETQVDKPTIQEELPSTRDMLIGRNKTLG